MRCINSFVKQPVSDNMSSRCWILLAVLSTLIVLTTTHRGRDGFRPGGLSRGGFRPGGFSRGGFRPGGFNRGGFRSGGLGRSGFRPGSWSRGGSRGGSAHRTKEVCPEIYSAVCSSKSSAQPVGQERKDKITSFRQILSCVDACKVSQGHYMKNS